MSITYSNLVLFDSSTELYMEKCRKSSIELLKCNSINTFEDGLSWKILEPDCGQASGGCGSNTGSNDDEDIDFIVDPIIEPPIISITDPPIGTDGGGGGDPDPDPDLDNNGDDDPTPPSETKKDALVAWGVPNFDVDVDITDLVYSLGNINDRSWAYYGNSSEQNPSASYVSYNNIASYTDYKGHIHIAYCRDEYRIYHVKYIPDSGWTTPTLVRDNDGTYMWGTYLNFTEFNNKIYLFHWSYDNSVSAYIPHLWNVDTEISERINIGYEYPNFIPWAESGAKCFYISSKGKMYFGFYDFENAVATAYPDIDDSGYISLEGTKWTILNFSDNPLNDSTYINPLNLDEAENISFSEDRNRIVHMVFFVDDFGENTKTMYRLSESSWDSVSEAEVLFQTTGSWNHHALGYNILNDNTHHIVYSGPSGSSPRFDRWANEFETVFDELNPLDQWDVKLLQKYEGLDSIDRAIIDIYNDGTIFKMNLFKSRGNSELPYYLGVLEWDQPGGYTNAKIEMDADLSFRGLNGELGMYFNGNTASDWNSFAGYYLTYSAGDGTWSSPVKLWKKEANKSSALMGTISVHDYLDNKYIPHRRNISVTVKHSGMYNVIVVDYPGYSRVFYDKTNPIRHGIGNKYGIFWKEGIYDQEVTSGDVTYQVNNLNLNVYRFKVTDLTPVLTPETNFDEGLWHLTNDTGVWKATQIAVDDYIYYPYSIKNGDKLHATWMDGWGDIYFATYENNEWKIDLVYDGDYFDLNENSVVAVF